MNVNKMESIGRQEPVVIRREQHENCDGGVEDDIDLVLLPDNQLLRPVLFVLMLLMFGFIVQMLTHSSDSSRIGGARLKFLGQHAE